MGGFGINRTKIDWADYSWNPITGCKHGCWYCYAKKLTQRFPKVFPNGFEPTFYPERLKEPWELQKPSKIFVCSISDLFGAWLPKGWKDQVLDSIEKCPVRHTFILLTKAPENIPRDYEFPENVWVGATVTSKSELGKIDQLRERTLANTIFVSFEPLLGPVKPDLNGIQWIIIGKLTGSKRIKLDPKWVRDLLATADFYKIPVFLKDNLGWGKIRREWPE